MPKLATLEVTAKPIAPSSKFPPIMSLQQKVRFYLEDIETPVGRWINLGITGLVLLSSAIFVAETYAIPPQVRIDLDALNQIILAVFSIEYLLRLWSTERKVHYVFSLYGLIDLLVILPFLLTTVDISFIRIFRWFRVLRLIRFIEGRTILVTLAGKTALFLSEFCLRSLPSSLCILG